MPTSVQITLVICATVLAIFFIPSWLERRRSRYGGASGRVGLYERFLAALSDVRADPRSGKAHARLASAAHAIALAAPPDIVNRTTACCRAIRATGLPPDATAARELLLSFRRDVGHADAEGELRDFEIVPSSPFHAPPAPAGESPRASAS